jgi:hypothetical protein
MTFLYRFFLAISTLALLIALYFFAVGLSDGSVSSFNIAIWMALLGALGANVCGGWLLNTRGHRVAAVLALAVVAVPAILAGLFLLLILILEPRWN